MTPARLEYGKSADDKLQIYFVGPNTKAISLYSHIDSCSFTTLARQPGASNLLTCKVLYSVQLCAYAYYM